jgi:MoaA/NifB/PqqE/SkfB family radical SAM enzyme
MHGKAPDVDFQKIVQVAARLVEEKKARKSSTTIGVSFLLTPDNYLDLVKAACVFRDVGVDYFQVKPIVMPAVERADAGMIFWNNQLFDMLVALNAYQTASFRIYALGYKFADMLLNEHAGLPFSRCWGHALYPTILADGSVIVCCDMLNAHLAGRPFGTYGRITAEHGFAELWTTPDRVRTGENIKTRLCPSNCKLSETNKTLERLSQAPPGHVNFIG